MAVSLAAGALLVRQLYLVLEMPLIDPFYTPAHDLGVSLALSSSGSILGAESLVPRNAIYATYPGVHMFSRDTWIGHRGERFIPLELDGVSPRPVDVRGNLSSR